ncbi:MAG TPA: branched-chain amino acid ABC transporter permease [Gaiellaceae bacterium]
MSTDVSTDAGGDAQARYGRGLRAVGPPEILVAAVAVAAVILIATKGLQPLAQTTANGLVSGTYYALGAAGLTLVYGVLKLINFAHGDMLTLGAYVALAVSSGLGVSVVFGAIAAIVAIATLGLALERIMWRPMRRRGAGMFQLVLMAFGLAFVIRYSIQLAAGADQRSLDVDVTSTVSFLDVRLGRTELIVIVVGFVVILLLGLLLKVTSVGKQIRALSDSPELAETTGINTHRVIGVTWVLSGGLAGLAGVLYSSSVGGVNPGLGYGIIMPLFCAVVLGGIGNAYGALVGGVLLGVVQEWSTLVITPSLKVAVGFAVLILVLVLRPQGIFGAVRAADR